MGKYLIDTNVISGYLSASLPARGMAMMDNVIDDIPNISVITEIELLCWNTDNVTEHNVRNFIADSNVLNITPDIIAQCIKVRKGKKIKTPDAIIAATALATGYTIITSNEKDFVNIKGLKIINPNLI